MSVWRTCVELIGAVVHAQEVIDHGGLSYAPGSQEEHHGFGGNLSICRARSDKK